MENQTLPTTNNVDETFLSKWSWGGFFLVPFWAMASKQVGLGIAIFVLGFIPFIPIAAGIYLGVKGRNFAWTKGEWTSFEAFKQRQKLLDKVGISLFVILTALTIFSIGGLMLTFGA